MRSSLNLSCCLLIFSRMIIVIQADEATVDVDGNWTEWIEDDLCCDNQRMRSRTCTNPPPSGKGTDCSGPKQLFFTCLEESCPECGCGEWEDFGPCCFGQKQRLRSCRKTEGEECEGSEVETADCESDVACYFPDESSCSELLMLVEPNVSDSFREDAMPTLIYEGPETCCQKHFTGTYEVCLGSTKDPVDGGFSEWTEWGCCNGRQSRFRVCNNPVPTNGGNPCNGTTVEELAVCNRNLPDNCNVTFTSTTINRSVSGVVVTLCLVAGVLLL